MARPGSTTSETGNNYQSANGTGAAVRAKLNEIFQALRTISSGSSDPSGAANIAQFQPHINTSTNELKIATAVSGDNATYVVLWKINEANFGHAALTGATFTGKVIHNYNSSLTMLDSRYRSVPLLVVVVPFQYRRYNIPFRMTVQ